MTDTIIITKDDYDEFRVPGPDGREATAYYTDSKEDAKLTAGRMYGAGVTIRFKRVEEHPEGLADNLVADEDCVDDTWNDAPQTGTGTREQLIKDCERTAKDCEAYLANHSVDDSPWVVTCSTDASYLSSWSPTGDSKETGNPQMAQEFTAEEAHQVAEIMRTARRQHWHAERKWHEVSAELESARNLLRILNP